MSELDWQRMRSERGPALGILDVRFDWMRHPAGEPVLKRLVLESVDWINVVALTRDGLSVMVDQFRFGIGTRTLETPGGMVDAGETPLQAAQRELLRRNRLRRRRVVQLGRGAAQPGDPSAPVSPLPGPRRRQARANRSRGRAKRLGSNCWI